MTLYQSYANALGWEKLTAPQLKALDYWEHDIENELSNPDRLCVYYPTGTGKTGISLIATHLRGHEEVLVIAPPSTQEKWAEDAGKLGMKIQLMSHAKFRMKSTQLSRTTAIIVDEFHMLGGHTGQGWVKLDRLARGLKAPLIINSATPNYNDAERVYCVAHVLDPHQHKGGYIGWLYEHCITQANPFAVMPEVTGFRNYKDAEEFLADLPGVVYIPDEAPDILKDVWVHAPMSEEFETLNVSRHTQRIMASQMEKRHQRRYHQIVDVTQRGHELDCTIQEDVMQQVFQLVDLDDEKVLIYCNHSSVAEVLYDTLVHGGRVNLVTGDTSPKEKDRLIEEFRSGDCMTLIGTATLATGTDGLDKICDTMVILDDTDDASLRRQLVGRILARGVGGSNDDKVAWRFVYSD